MYKCHTHTHVLQTFNETSQNSTPVISYYQTYAPCTHIQGSGPSDEGFLTTTVSLGTSACTRQPIYWALMMLFPVQFPSWLYLSLPAAQLGGRINSLTPTVRLHLPQSLNLNFLPAQTTHQRKTTYPCQTGASSPTCPMTAYPRQWDYPVSTGTLQKMPTLQPGQEDVSGL